MKTFDFNVTQQASTYYKGKIAVQAENEERAKELIQSMSQEELEEKCTDWVLADAASADGDIEVWENVTGDPVLINGE